jgi:hypothetical protein
MRQSVLRFTWSSQVFTKELDEESYISTVNELDGMGNLEIVLMPYICAA